MSAGRDVHPGLAPQGQPPAHAPARDQQLVFAGEVLAGFEVDAVRQSLAELLHLDARRLDPLFSGRRVIVKRRLSADQAAAWVRQFEALGARLQAVPMNEATPAEPAESAAGPQAPTPTPTPTPPPTGTAEPRTREADAALFSLRWRGRIGRVRNAVGSLLVLTGLLWLIMLEAALPGPITLALLLLGAVVLTLWGCRLTVLRLHDVNRSGWWALVFLLPTAGVVASLVLSCWPGSPDDNRHGAPPADDSFQTTLAVLMLLCVSLGAGGRMAISTYERYAAQLGGGGLSRLNRPDNPVDDPARPAHSALARALYSDTAVAEFLLYRTAASHRAFAVSSDGAWGWQAGAPTAEQADRAAMLACEHRRTPYSTRCRIVHVDEQWAMNL